MINVLLPDDQIKIWQREQKNSSEKGFHSEVFLVISQLSRNETNILTDAFNRDNRAIISRHPGFVWEIVPI